MFKKIALSALSLIVFSSVLPHNQVLADTSNLITNPSLETEQSATVPQGWVTTQWGLVTSSFSYPTTGHTGNHSVRVDVTADTGDGAANWYQSTRTPVTAGQQYQFTDWYQSNIATEAGVEFFNAAGTQLTDAQGGYAYLGAIEASTAWKQFSGTFSVPAGAVSANIFHLIANVGYLVTDDYGLATYTPTGFNRAMVSVTFDDGWKSQITAANMKAMTDNGIKGTYYIISGTSANPTTQDANYMTPADVKMLDQSGYEIGSHTVHHCDLTGQQTDDATVCPMPISSTQVTSELADSQAALQALIGKPVTDFAYPYGGNNAATAVEGSKHYQSLRTVSQGYNTLDNLAPTKLMMFEVDQGITPATVKSWVDQAIAEKAWLILTYHEISTTPTKGDEFYNATPADFATEMAYIGSKSASITSLTMAQALAEAMAQKVAPTPTPTPTPTPITKPGDLNGDAVVDALDLSTLLTNWGKTGMTTAQGDINKDGTVDALDLSTLLTNWSK